MVNSMPTRIKAAFSLNINDIANATKRRSTSNGIDPINGMIPINTPNEEDIAILETFLSESILLYIKLKSRFIKIIPFNMLKQKPTFEWPAMLSSFC